MKIHTLRGYDETKPESLKMNISLADDSISVKEHSGKGKYWLNMRAATYAFDYTHGIRIHR